MRKHKAPRKGHDPLAEALKTPPPNDLPAALMWLYQIYAVLKGMFIKNLPEALDFSPKDNAPPEFVVVAWVDSHADARAQIRMLWSHRAGVWVHRDGIMIKVGGSTREDIRFHLATLREKAVPKILNHAKSEDPKDVDFLIADMATKVPGACLTLIGPGVQLRLNRKARRAALSRVKRTLRRETRRVARLAGRRHT